MMTPEQIQAIVLKHLHELVPATQSREITGATTMRDLGADSLDLVDVASRSMQELQVKIPRSELGKIHTLDDLVGVLHRMVQAREAANV
jgi:acyl carrier protein